MDYEKMYKTLMETRREMGRTIGAGYEQHHVIPRSIGGTDDADNLWYIHEYFSTPQWEIWCRKVHGEIVPSGPVPGRFGKPMGKALAEHISSNRNVTIKQVRSSACSKECRKNAKN